MKYLLIISVLFAGCGSKKETKKEFIPPLALEVEQPKYTIADSSADASYNYKVTLVQGKHKFGGTTKIEYLNTLQIMNNAKKFAKSKMWTDEKLNKLLDFIKINDNGGKIKLNIERNTIDGANTNMFSVVVKDTAGVELFRKKFDAEVAEVPSDTKYWWNMGELNVDKKIRPPFDIFLVDNLQDVPFKFTVR